MVSSGPKASVIVALRNGLRKLGYVDGESIRFELRTAQGQAERLPALAEELVQLKVDIIVSAVEPAIRAAKQATSTIPIVMVAYDYDPVASGVVQSLSRPGGNVTGIFTRHPALNAKRLELLHEALPSVSHLAVFWDSFSREQLQELARPARAVGFHIQPVELHPPYDFEAAFKLAKKKAGAVVVLFSPVFYVNHARIANLALENGLPTIYQERDYVEAGGLMSYGLNMADTFGRAAYYIDRLLKGAKPADMPIEQPSRFWLVINLRTAKTLRVTIPESILLRADEVIR